MKHCKGLRIVHASFRDAEAIARLHEQYIHLGFLSSLGRRFLSLLYRGLARWDSGILIAAKKQGRIIGFVSGVKNVREFYSFFVRNYWAALFPVLFFRIFDPRIIRRIAETLLYPGKTTGGNIPHAELLSIVVDRENQSKGAAGKLLSGLVREFTKQQCLSFRVVVGAALKQAIAFYEKSGFIRAGSIRVHHDALSRIYVYRIKSEKRKRNR